MSIHTQGESCSELGQVLPLNDPPTSIRGVIENKHSTDVESPPPPQGVYTSVHPDGESRVHCSNLGWSGCSERPWCTVQDEFHKYLEARGVDSTLANYIFEVGVTRHLIFTRKP